MLAAARTMTMASLAAPTIWIVALDGFEPDALAHLCAPEDVQRQSRLRFPHLRRRAAVRSAALRHILGKALGLRPESLTFERDSWGKPVLALTTPRAQARHAIHFNLSHSQERAAVILADSPVGIDLEHTGPDRGWDEMSDIVCSPSERALIEALPAVARTRAFYRLWVAKEAAVKADGRGLSLPVNRIDAGALAREACAARVWMPASQTFLHIRGFDLGQDHVGAVAAASPIGEPRLALWSPD